MTRPQPWIHSALFDGALIVGPALIATLIVLVFQKQFAAIPETPIVAWFFLVVAVDVAHVYSTLFRTYLDRAERKRRRDLYLLTPVAAWVIGIVLYSLGALVFWRAMAYLAVFHFVRQQFGFLMIYKRHERAEPHWSRRLDQMTIYGATLAPLLWWHTHSDNGIHWFIDQDFLVFDAPWIGRLGMVIFACLFALYLAKETRRPFNAPKNLFVLGTAASWFVGIVILRGDFAFTVTNVIAHGVPYTALVWAHGRKLAARRKPLGIEVASGGRWFRLSWIPAFMGLLIVLAYVEEGLWDGFIWRDHEAGFPWFAALPRLTDGVVVALVVPLLSVPQITHYILDGFIWKMRQVMKVQGISDPA